ncbi:SAM-dependent methyltransferase [Haloferula sargassicola]|uniref:SAM-dependent methyltransferase n=1 Tax=Haloferula sargassicola TaxID=490096 RepID=A0ABP9UT32_9BACT
MPDFSSFPWPVDGGALRFDEFMAAALYDPALGYYGRRIREVGRRGDFSTSASLGGLLGEAVAAWARGAMKSTGCRDLIELGPGNGTLARQVRESFPWHRRPRLHLVERSPALRAIQQQTLGAKASWHDSLTAALAACGGRACVYSNEFVDAFPVRRFRREPTGWAEQFVLPDASLWRPCPSLPSSSIFERDWPPGHVVEVHDSFHHWLRQNLAGWKSGRMLTIDYGDEIHGLYHRQPGGSLRAYFHHQCLTGPEALARPGHQDLTADVNFTDLARWLAPVAARVSLKSQSAFLADHADNSGADRFLADPDGAGGAFLVLDMECRL